MTCKRTGGVQNFNTVVASAGGCVEVPVEELAVGCVDVTHVAVEARTVDTDTSGTCFKVHARHTFEGADGVTYTQSEATHGCEETRAVEACTARSVVTAFSLCTEASAERNATVGFGRHVELQTQTAGDVCFGHAVYSAVVAVVVVQTKTAVTADPHFGGGHAGSSNQRRRCEENLFHRFSLGFKSYAQTGESSVGMQRVSLLNAVHCKAWAGLCGKVVADGAGLPQY